MATTAPIQHIPQDPLGGSKPTSSTTEAPPFINVTNPDDARVSFRTTDYDTAIPIIRARFPNVDPLYFVKIFRGIVRAEGLVWLDVGRQDVTPADFTSLAHLLYCFEVYGQVICCFAAQGQGQAQVQGMEGVELELQRALADYRLRLLQLSRVTTFESLREWHKAVVTAQLREGQDRVEGWRDERVELQGLLQRYRQK